MDYSKYGSTLLHDFTLSLPYVYDVPAHKQHTEAIDIIKRLFNKCSDHYIVYPEFTSQCRLHYHGIIRITDKIKWIRSVFGSLLKQLRMDHKCVQFRMIKSFNSHLRWLWYIRKHWDTTKRVLRIESPLIYRKAIARPKIHIEILHPANEKIPLWFITGEAPLYAGDRKRAGRVQLHEAPQVSQLKRDEAQDPITEARSAGQLVAVISDLELLNLYLEI